ncbi:Ig-like domain-containing protein [Pseudolysinimonas sp.]|jgi:hypothetical protein|uniref:Ig-like domain-containing protein n=1 Tax=Pseudolysinimonas sp. TaxID=2680009 RepID=UPI0037837985
MATKRSRLRLISGIATVAIAASAVVVAVLHEGFPRDDVDLVSRDVWVTRGDRLLVGRLDRQIEELRSAVSTSGSQFDVLQNGADAFVYDAGAGSVERIDPSFVSLGERLDVPPGSSVSYGDERLAIASPEGDLWVLDTTTELAFDASQTTPVLSLGTGALVSVGPSGEVFAASLEESTLYRLRPGSLTPEVVSTALPDGDVTMTVVGDRAAFLADGDVVLADGRRVELPSPGLRLQQPGPTSDGVAVATTEALVIVGFDGVPRTAVTARADGGAGWVAAPVVTGSCVYGAWVAPAVYAGVCGSGSPVRVDLDAVDAAARLEFRAHRGVVALNDLVGGGLWIVDDEFIDIEENWEEVTPPNPDEGDETDESTTVPTFEEIFAERTEQNRAPLARPDSFGARPGSATILPVLDNDADPDGDVLTIVGVSDVPAAAGTVQVVDGGRALQFQPNPGVSTVSVSFRYTADDGRPGGVAEAQVDVSVRPPNTNVPPVTVRSTSVPVETSQTISYNVLRDWVDPDGDDLIVLDATATTGDLVRFSADGLVTFTSRNAELGPKPVTVIVSDGNAPPVTAELVFDVRASGTLRPVGTPDFGATVVGRVLELYPLANDLSPSGAGLALVDVSVLTPGLTAEADTDSGRLTIRAPAAGTYYLVYGLRAGSTTASGLVRVDAVVDPDQPPPPIAVTDTAYLRPNEQVVIPVLTNDVSPRGAVLGVQGVESPLGSPLSVEVLGSTVVRVSAPSSLIEQSEFEYTISDGTATSTATVTIIPVPELLHHQAPIATDDLVRVRAGDMASVAVLANDIHPDGAALALDPVLVEADLDDGLAFVTGDRVRVQAPSVAGSYELVYRVTDAFGEASTAVLQVVVVAADPEGNRPPAPRVVTARVFAGSEVTIAIPLDGIDPDGDSVEFVSAGGGTQGTVLATDARSFVFTAASDGAGTDVLEYEVRDALGELGTGEVRIGVIPRGGAVLMPVAVDDEIAVRPGRVTAVPVLANDSDPNGFGVELERELVEVQPGMDARVAGSVIEVMAGADEGSFYVRYRIGNGRGGTDDGYLLVTVDEDAVVGPPIARDRTVTAAEVVGERSVVVDVRDGAINPGGLVADLEVGVAGPNARFARVSPDGTVTVELGDTRRAIAFRLTNTVDDLTGWAFVIVPRYSDGTPPALKPELIENPPQLDANSTGEWRLADILDVSNGREAIVIDPDDATALRSNGDPVVLDERTIRYTPEADYRGESVITFRVTDGASAADESGNVAVIRMTVVVGDPGFRDVDPEFADATIEIEPGEANAGFDLRAASSHPNPDVVAELSYSNLRGDRARVDASISGSRLVLAAPPEATGDVARLEFDIAYGSRVVTGSVTVVVVPSTRPLAQAIEDTVPEGRPDSSYPVDVLVNDVNPFPAGTPLRVLDAVIQGPTLGATVTTDASTVRVRTGPAKSGTVTIIYTIEDATERDERRVQGRLVVQVSSAPEPVTQISLSNPASQTVTVVFDPPSSSNGSEITRYDVQIAGAEGAATRSDCVPGADCTFTGRTNGAPQSVRVTATNTPGSTTSGEVFIVPYGTPGTPTGVQFASGNGGEAPGGSVTMTWGLVDSGGGDARYFWILRRDGAQVDANYTTNAGSVTRSGLPQGTYTFEVRACNAKDAGGGAWSNCGSSAGSANSSVVIPPQPRITDAGKGPLVACEYGTCAYIRLYVSGITGSQTVCMYGKLAGSPGPYDWWFTTECLTATFNGTYGDTPFYLSNSGNVGAYDMHAVIPGLAEHYDTIW